MRTYILALFVLFVFVACDETITLPCAADILNAKWSASHSAVSYTVNTANGRMFIGFDISGFKTKSATPTTATLVLGNAQAVISDSNVNVTIYNADRFSESSSIATLEEPMGYTFYNLSTKEATPKTFDVLKYLISGLAVGNTQFNAALGVVGTGSVQYAAREANNMQNFLVITYTGSLAGSSTTKPTSAPGAPSTDETDAVLPTRASSSTSTIAVGSAAVLGAAAVLAAL